MLIVWRHSHTIRSHRTQTENSDLKCSLQRETAFLLRSTFSIPTYISTVLLHSYNVRSARRTIPPLCSLHYPTRIWSPSVDSPNSHRKPHTHTHTGEHHHESETRHSATSTPRPVLSYVYKAHRYRNAPHTAYRYTHHGIHTSAEHHTSAGASSSNAVARGPYSYHRQQRDFRARDARSPHSLTHRIRRRMYSARCSMAQVFLVRLTVTLSPPHHHMPALSVSIGEEFYKMVPQNASEKLPILFILYRSESEVYKQNIF